MTLSNWFDDLPVLGKLPADQAVVKLREMGENAAADALETAGEAATRTFGTTRWWWPFQDKPWQHTAHAFGYLAPAGPGNTPLPIRHAGNIESDLSLKNG